ncbi:MAG: hypothetical protein AUK43_09315 [Oscillatoriales cyanobacterium CG2_30_40_61]|nr:MAG: hypothetical protein AUK43_09315 [Oscillatoriales cyanobacterium CG2_30_40_61]
MLSDNVIKGVERVVGFIFPVQIEDNTPTITAAKLWITFGLGIWLIVTATSLAYGPGREVLGVPTEIIWLLSGLLLIILGVTRIGVKRNQL